VETDGQGIYVSVSQEKWDKWKLCIGDIVKELSQTKELSQKELDRKQGFLIYMTRMYPAMVPYFEGIRPTLEMWRPNRDKAGWKGKALQEKDLLAAAAHAEEPPKPVRAVPWLAGDLEALQHLTLSVLTPQAEGEICNNARGLLRFWGRLGDGIHIGHGGQGEGVTLPRPLV
jgi:hypothetical protein